MCLGHSQNSECPNGEDSKLLWKAEWIIQHTDERALPVPGVSHMELARTKTSRESYDFFSKGFHVEITKRQVSSGLV